MTSDLIGSDPISMISDQIRSDAAPAATTGIGSRSCLVARRRRWITILASPPTRGSGTGSEVIPVPAGASTSAAPDRVARCPRPRRAIPRAGRRVAVRGIVAHASPVVALWLRAESRGGQSPPSISCLRAGSQSPPVAPRVRGRDRDQQPAPRRAARDRSPPQRAGERRRRRHRPFVPPSPVPPLHYLSIYLGINLREKSWLGGSPKISSQRLGRFYAQTANKKSGSFFDHLYDFWSFQSP